jgi:hypothetical protein
VVPGASPTFGELDPAAVRATADRLGEALVRIEHAEPEAADGATCARELAQAIRLARHGAWRLLREAGARGPGPAELRADLLDAIEEQRACWRLRSREGGLADSVARLERALAAPAARGGEVELP